MPKGTELAIATALEGFTRGLSRGLNKRRTQQDTKREFELREKALDIREKQGFELAGIKDALTESKEEKIDAQSAKLRSDERNSLFKLRTDTAESLAKVDESLATTSQRLASIRERDPGNPLVTELEKTIASGEEQRSLFRDTQSEITTALQALKNEKRPKTGVTQVNLAGGATVELPDNLAADITSLQDLRAASAGPSASPTAIAANIKSAQEVIERVNQRQITPSERRTFVKEARAVFRALVSAQQKEGTRQSEPGSLLLGGRTPDSEIVEGF